MHSGFENVKGESKALKIEVKITEMRLSSTQEMVQAILN